ncbi:hypothetical protein GCM10027046_14670 [Uliginosibacterium flavum]|uniref:HD domain-containing phosphohydrolase n=1 Tax=Uliginosibacterium flavum TaxID=1396831 RepID=A0ABV2TQH3_9RHOO
MSPPDPHDPAIPALPTQANPHFLRALSSLAEETEVQASEDVFAQNGTKLLARGARITPGLYEQIINHRLRTPLETSLASAEGLDTAALCRVAEQALDETPLLRSFCHWSQGRVTPLGMLEHLHFSPQACTLLAVADRHSPANRPHHVRVALIAMGLANAWRYNDAHLLASMGVAGLFHDVGELYVDPALSQRGHEISTREWMAFSAHPIIGAALAREVAKLDKLTQAAILDHHERIDGFGYPRARRRAEVSVGGQILGLAEMISALVSREQPRQHLSVALKILPGEFAPDLVSLIGALCEDCPPDTPTESEESDMPDDIHRVFARIAATQEIYANWQTSNYKFSPAAESATHDVFERFIGVQKAFASTGMDSFEVIAPLLSPAELREARVEARCVLNEIFWRLTRIARELALRCMKLPEGEAQVLMQLVDALAGKICAEDSKLAA